MLYLIRFGESVVRQASSCICHRHRIREEMGIMIPRQVFNVSDILDFPRMCYEGLANRKLAEIRYV